MKRAIAYQRRRQIFLHSSSQTDVGVWILSPPVLAVDQGDKARLGNAVLAALESSRENVPHSLLSKDLFKPVLDMARVGTWANFAESAKCVEIEFGTNHVSLQPTRNLSPGGGFEVIAGKALDSPPVDEELGAALAAAFEESK